MRYILFVTFILCGCQYSHRPNVIVATGTVIGVDIGESLKSGLPSIKLGYNRGEVIYATPHEGKVPPVVAELSYGGIRQLTSGKIYQRVAMGDAVNSPAVQQLFSNGSNFDIYETKISYIDSYDKKSEDEKSRWNKVATDNKFVDFYEFIIDSDLETIKKLLGEL